MFFHMKKHNGIFGTITKKKSRRGNKKQRHHLKTPKQNNSRQTNQRHRLENQKKTNKTSRGNKISGIIPKIQQQKQCKSNTNASIWKIPAKKSATNWKKKQCDNLENKKNKRSHTKSQIVSCASQLFVHDKLYVATVHDTINRLINLSQGTIINYTSARSD